AEAVCFAPFPEQMVRHEPGPNEWLAKELASHGRLRGFGTIDLRRTDVRDQVRRANELGFGGLKLHPNTQKFDILDPRALDLYSGQKRPACSSRSTAAYTN